MQLLRIDWNVVFTIINLIVLYLALRKFLIKPVTNIMELIKIVAPVLVPVPLSLYFDLFDGFIQAYVFVFLTSLFIKESIE